MTEQAIRTPGIPEALRGGYQLPPFLTASNAGVRWLLHVPGCPMMGTDNLKCPHCAAVFCVWARSPNGVPRRVLVQRQGAESYTETAAVVDLHTALVVAINAAGAAR